MFKKVFQVIGLLVLVCISFMYTEKAMIVVREQDPLMIELNEKKELYYKAPINVYINGKDIIPGYEGIEVDIDSSYENMKKYGLYNESMLKFKNVVPNNSVNNIYDKYIVSGNKLKNSISLIFVVNKNDDISKVLEILEKNKTVATFFMDKQYIENNKDLIKKIVSLGNEVGHTNYNNDEELLFVNRTISNLSREFNYCYVNSYNDDVLNLCRAYSMHVIKPTVISGNNMIISIKKIIGSGTLFSFSINKNLNEELDHIITYVNQKGYTITTLSEHLSEKRLEK